VSSIVGFILTLKGQAFSSILCNGLAGSLKAEYKRHKSIRHCWSRIKQSLKKLETLDNDGRNMQPVDRS
jgi:hypothetical protein